MNTMRSPTLFRGRFKMYPPPPTYRFYILELLLAVDKMIVGCTVERVLRRGCNTVYSLYRVVIL